MQINDGANSLTDLVLVTDAVEGRHKPIITSELANRVLATRHRRKALGVRRDDHVYLLTPVLRCATCGQPLRGKVGRRSGYTYSHRSRGKGCHHADGTFEAEVLEEEVKHGLNLEMPATTIADIRESVERRTRSKPENSTVQEKIDTLEKRRERLRELYLMGEYERDDYHVLHSDIMREIQDLERKLSGPDYSVESVLTKLDRLSDILECGTRGQQKKVLGMLFESVSIDGDGTIQEVELQKWARPLFADLLIVNGDHVCPQGNSNPCRRRERAVSSATRRWGQHRPIVAEVAVPVKSNGLVFKALDRKAGAVNTNAPGQLFPLLVVLCYNNRACCPRPQGPCCL